MRHSGARRPTLDVCRPRAYAHLLGPTHHQVMHRYMMLSAICIKGTVEELEAYARSVSEGYRPPIDAKWPPELRTLIEVRGHEAI